MTYSVIEAVDRLTREVQGMRQQLQAVLLAFEAQGRHALASEADTELVYAVHAVLGEQHFTAAVLLRMAMQPGAPEAALLALLGTSPKSVGKALRRASGRPCAATGLALQHAGDDHGAAIWRVCRVSNPPKTGIP